MSEQLSNPKQALKITPVPDSLVQELNNTHLVWKETSKFAFDHILRCCELLLQAKAAVPAGQWDRWLADNFDGDADMARFYMRHDPESDDDMKAQLIPPPGKSLRFDLRYREAGLVLCIDPSCEEGYYYLTKLSWDFNDDGTQFSHAEGPPEPIWRDDLWETCQRFEYDKYVECSEPTELPATPVAFNRWHFVGYEEHYQPHGDRKLHAEALPQEGRSAAAPSPADEL